MFLTGKKKIGLVFAGLSLVLVTVAFNVNSDEPISASASTPANSTGGLAGRKAVAQAPQFFSSANAQLVYESANSVSNEFVPTDEKHGSTSVIAWLVGTLLLSLLTLSRERC